MNNKIHVIAYGARGTGMSGGDRLSIGFCKGYSEYADIFVYVNEEGKEMYKREGVKANYIVSDASKFRRFFLIHYFAVLIFALIKSLRISLNNNEKTTVYAASDFWMDSFTAFILKLRFRKINLVGTFYLIAPKPFRGWVGSIKIPSPNDIMYFISQKFMALPLIWLSDIIFVTNYSIKDYLVEKGANPKKIAVTKIIVKKANSKKKQRKEFDSVFMGRLHPQKGIKELIDVWKIVLEKYSKAKFAIIGDGDLANFLKKSLKENNMAKNVKLFGFVTGEKKDKILASAKTFVHTEVYGIGCAAPVEFMRFGIPGVCFNLPTLRGFYEEGAVLAENKNVEDFANKLLKLLEDKKFYNEMSKKAKKAAVKFYPSVKTNALKQHFIK